MPDIYSSQHETVHRTERKRTGQDAGQDRTARNAAQHSKGQKPQTENGLN